MKQKIQKYQKKVGRSTNIINSGADKKPDPLVDGLGWGNRSSKKDALRGYNHLSKALCLGHLEADGNWLMNW